VRRSNENCIGTDQMCDIPLIYVATYIYTIYIFTLLLNNIMCITLCILILLNIYIYGISINIHTILTYTYINLYNTQYCWLYSLTDPQFQLFFPITVVLNIKILGGEIF
jgi:hypothetical protein